jgi:nitroreductase
VVQQALECLNLARRAPSGFNAQPYKLVLVNTPEQKQKLARYCIGHNAHRVRDSDCTAVFLADREAVRTLGFYKSFLLSNNPKWKERPWGLFKIQAIIALFSSGYPLPRILAVPISFGVRLGMSCLSIITFRRLLLPSLAGAETWSTKNTMLVAMAYMLGCTSRNLATCPMEGFNASGVRKALNIPRRYSIPIIVSTGRPFVRPKDAAATEADSSDDMGMTHGSPSKGSINSSPRYQPKDVVYQDLFGQPASNLAC